MDTHKARLESLINKCEWVQAFCAPCDNEVTY